MEEQRKKERTVQEKGEPASLSRVTVAQWWHSENERGLSVDRRSLTGNKATGCLRIADSLYASLEILSYSKTMALIPAPLIPSSSIVKSED